MKINSMTAYHEDAPKYTSYYIATVVIAIVLGYFLVIGSKLLRVLFILVWEYWWVAIIIILAIILLRKKLKVK